jgi:hypothetical protein
MMRAALARSCALMAVSSAQAQGNSKDFPPGFNGMALTPPQGCARGTAALYPPR